MKIDREDPAFIAHVKIVDALTPFTRIEQLRVLAATCVMLGEYDYAERFLNMLANEARREAEKAKAAP